VSVWCVCLCAGVMSAQPDRLSIGACGVLLFEGRGARGGGGGRCFAVAVAALAPVYVLYICAVCYVMYKYVVRRALLRSRVRVCAPEDGEARCLFINCSTTDSTSTVN